jgi:hypothetical protein
LRHTIQSETFGFIQLKARNSDTNLDAEHLRSSRFKESEDGWYYVTREGITVGPFEDQFDAELSASLLFSRLAQIGSEADAVNEIHRFINDPMNPIARADSNVTRPSSTQAAKAAQPFVRRLQRLLAFRG